MKITRILFSAAIMVALLLTSCQQKAGQQKTTQTDEVDEFEEKIRNINPGLEDPTVVLATLEMAGAEYIEGLVVPMENVEYYAQDEALAALALGVYTVDIAYLVSYGKNDEALVKYERARKAATIITTTIYVALPKMSPVSIRRATNTTVAAMINMNMNVRTKRRFFGGWFARAGADPDSLKKDLTMTARNIDREMSQGERARHSVLFVTGEFVEKMHILTQVIDRYPKDFPEEVRSQLLRHMIMGIVEQEELLNDLIDLLNQIREVDEGEEFMAEMNALKQIYDEANFKEMIANWTPQTTAGGEYLARITERVAQIRERIVSTEM